MPMWMIDPMLYPLGDVETWVRPAGEVVLNDLNEFASIVASAPDSLHAFRRSPSSEEVMRLRAAAIFGTDADKLAYEDLLRSAQVVSLRDRVSGFSYSLAEPAEPGDNLHPARLGISPYAGPKEDEILQVARTRYVLSKLTNRGVPPHVHPSATLYGNPSVLCTPIVDYEAKTITELQHVMNLLDDVLVKKLRARRLWFRGQTQQFPFSRDPDLCKLLQFPEDGNGAPSLVPSLGRFALKSPDKIDRNYAFGGPSHEWKKPFIVWLCRQEGACLKRFPEFADRLTASLQSDDDLVFAQLLNAMSEDIRLDRIDDLRQYFFAFFKYSAWTWVLQQYGYLASMLDVTTNLDIALFFSQARMENNRFLLPEPTETRVIYVFMQRRESSVFFHPDEVELGIGDWKSPLPARIGSQAAGCISGSTWFRQNYYGHLIVARIFLKGSGCITTQTVHKMFPTPEEDSLLATLLEAKPQPEGLYW